ncbi:MAG: IS4 family transposase [Polyangiaceae bacterium]|nr:IS4 family transposase [Polyangiaceae bacterium]
MRLANQLSDSPDSSFPSVLNEGQLEGAYRLFSNVAVTLDGILAPHIASTWERTTNDDVVTLALHDTTTMSFRAFGQRKGIVASSRGGTQQFLAHTSLAVRGDQTRRPYGVLALSTHQLEHNPQVHDRWRKQITAVATHTNAHRNVIHVMDREADDYALLASLIGAGHRFIVRAQYNRVLPEQGTLREALGSVAIADEREVTLSARGRAGRSSKHRRIHPVRKSRVTTLAFAARELSIPRTASAPKDASASLSVNVVHVWETSPPQGETPVEWLLLTSEPITTPEQIVQVVDWYRSRWVIEEYFKALKTGCAYEKRQLESFHALRNALALFAPMAWQLLLLRTEGRHHPLSPASLVVSHDQLEVLRVAGRKSLPPHPTARDVMLAVAALGGHLPRNGDPGWLVLARGLEKLEALSAGWCFRKARERSDQ